MDTKLYTGNNQDIKNFCGLSPKERKAYCIQLFVDKVFEKNIITQYCPSPEMLYDILNERIKVVNLDFKSEGERAGYWDYNDIYICPNKINDSVALSSAIFHEVLHAYSTEKDFCGIMNRKNGRGRGINEGITEYITQKHIESSLYHVGSYNEWHFFINGSYEHLQMTVKLLCVILGEKEVLDDYFGNSQYVNMYNTIDKYNFHKTPRVSKKLLDRVYSWGDIICNKRDDTKIRDNAFISLQEELIELFFLQRDYLSKSENINELQTIWSRYFDLEFRGSGFRVLSRKHEIDFDMNFMITHIAKSIVNSYTTDYEQFDFKYDFLCSCLEEYEKISYRGIANSNLNIVFRDDEVITIYQGGNPTMRNSYSLQELHDIKSNKKMQDTREKELYGEYLRLEKKILGSVYENLQKYLNETKIFSKNATVGFTEDYIIINENYNTVCLRYNDTGEIYPQKLDVRKSFVGDKPINMKGEKSPVKKETLKYIFRKTIKKLGINLKKHESNYVFSKPIKSGVLLARIMEKIENEPVGTKAQTRDNSIDSKLISSICGMESKEYEKYKEEHASDYVKKETSLDKGRDVMDR